MRNLCIPTVTPRLRPLLGRGMIVRDDAQEPKSKYGYIMRFKSNPAIGDQVYFNNIPFANRVFSLQVFSSSQQASLYSQGASYTVPTADNYAGAVLHLCDENQRIILSKSMGSMAQETDNGQSIYINQPISWRNSYVEFTDAAQGLTTSNAFYIGITYHK